MTIPDIVQLLPDAIANQIAAGEVVQRPASAVKELLENAIDAEATSIQVIIHDAGKELIQVVDDGKGMSPTDARMCFERHATSKIRTGEDLFRIKTMGFRGEALASIAAIAQVELKTARAGEELGTLIKIEGSSVKSQESVSWGGGTSIQVKNLFYNVPARRNFLKSNPVEMRHIIDEFQRVALANPEVAFTLHHNGQEVFNLTSGKLVRRITDIFGKNYREQLAFCQEDTSLLSIRGYIGKPEFAKKTRGEQFFFVNNRYIKSSYLNHAILTAFDGTLPEGSHPFYVLFIEIDPSHIDINIHPTKSEIKFDDERSVYAIIMAAVRKAIGVYNLGSSIDFDNDINFLSPPRSSDAKPVSFNIPGHSSWNSEKPPGAFSKNQSVQDWVKLFEGLDMREEESPATSSIDFSKDGNDNFEPQSFTAGSRANQMATERIGQPATEASYAQLFNRYIISQSSEDTVLIDQRAAWERILYEQYKKMITKRSGGSQQLLFPKTVRLSASDMQLVQETLPSIKALGFEFDDIGGNTLIIRGVPSDIPDENEQEMFEELLDQIRQNYAELKLSRPDGLIRSLAKRFAPKYNLKMSTQEIREMLNRLFDTSDPNRTPSGEPITIRLSVEKLASIFKPVSKNK